MYTAPTLQGSDTLAVQQGPDKRALYKMLYFAKETYNFKEPTNRSQPMTVQQGPDTLYLYNSAHIRQTLLHKSPMYPSAGRRSYLKGAVHIVL